MTKFFPDTQNLVQNFLYDNPTDKKEKVKQTKSLYNQFSPERETANMYSSSRVKVVY